MVSRTAGLALMGRSLSTSAWRSESGHCVKIAAAALRFMMLGLTCDMGVVAVMRFSDAVGISINANGLTRKSLQPCLSSGQQHEQSEHPNSDLWSINCCSRESGPCHSVESWCIYAVTLDSSVNRMHRNNRGAPIHVSA